MNKKISVSPNVHFGKPCVRGTRITVQNVLELVSDGISFEKIAGDYYPELGIADIQACVRLPARTELPASGGEVTLHIRMPNNTLY